MTAAIAAANSATATETSKAAASGTKLAQSFDTFLVMLTTQLKNQDPLSPMDSTEFTNQLVQFANVEQQINANSNLERLIKVNQTNQTAFAINYLGNNIEADTEVLPLQDGKASFSYTLAEDADKVTISIKDLDGNLVRTITGSGATKGRHEATWDGKDNNGLQLKDGAYVVEVAGLAADGSTVDWTNTVYGRVTDIASDDTGVLLNMGGSVVNLDKVLTVRAPAPATAGGSTTTTTTSTDTASDNTTSTAVN